MRKLFQKLFSKRQNPAEQLSLSAPKKDVEVEFEFEVTPTVSGFDLPFGLKFKFRKNKRHQPLP